jgi:hypothetical protein
VAVFVTFLLVFGLPFGALSAVDDLPSVWAKMRRAEQLENDRVENRRVFDVLNQNEIDPSQMPEKQPLLEIEKLFLPRNQVEVIDTQNGAGEKSLTVTIDGKTYVELLIHPESRGLYVNERTASPSVELYQGTPLSSIRSMFIWKPGKPSLPSYVKLTLNRWIGGALRILTKGQIERAAAISYLLKSMDLKKYSDEGIHFVDEPLHVYLLRNKTGYSVRSFPSAGLDF